MLLPELASDIVDAADEVENTALHFCQKTNCASKVTETLLSAKASVDIKNKAEESALNDSSEETSPNNQQKIYLLIGLDGSGIAF